jgi:hypothetical protein
MGWNLQEPQSLPDMVCVAFNVDDFAELLLLLLIKSEGRVIKPKS